MKDKNKTVSFGLRIITVDYYLSLPVPELDITVSNFRGSAVKQVPIVRIFGTTSTGKKACMHVHGVFPYLYIPCEDTTPEPKQTYQIANSIDKAINISLKQSNSSNQHVYKVILVKGIPFYGFHSKNHQFYKIFFYNPLFVKRTADLLQSGAIMGMSYQPNEAHINYVMQFFIDFNLYGMTFINLECVKFRRKNSNLEDTYSQNATNDRIAFPDSLQCMSTCECEVDCLAMHILNRREILNGNLGVNPGLEALWEDERKRHENLHMSHEIMPTPSQIRENIPTTESHNYFDKKLKVKLIINSEMNEKFKSDVTMGTSFSENGGILNSSHKDSLNTSIYPAETPEEENLMNATSITLHHPSLQMNKGNEHIFSESIVDEDIINQSQFSNSEVLLNSEDFEFMMLLKEMDDDEKIENDSILFSQPIEAEGDGQQEVDNFSEIINDDLLSSKIPSCNVDDTNSIIDTSSQPLSWHDSFWENVENISQLDGTWDEEDDNFQPRRSLRLGLSKPQKRKKKTNDNQEKLQNNTTKKQQNKPFNLEEQFKVFEVTPIKTQIKSPKRSPVKTPRNFEPLNIIIQRSPSLASTSDSATPTKRKLLFKPKLKARRIIKSQEYLKTSNITNFRTSRSCHGIEKDHSSTNDIHMTDDSESAEICKQTNPKETTRNLIMSNLSPIDCDNLLSLNDKIKSKSLTASQYDKQNNYVPQPGSSKLFNNFDEDVHLSVSNLDESLPNNRDIISFYDTTIYNDTSMFNDVNKEDMSPTPKPQKPIAVRSHSEVSTKSKTSNSELKLWFNDLTLDSVGNKTTFNGFEMDCNPFIRSQNKFKKIVLVPKILPPSYTDVSSTLHDFNIPEQYNPLPFYSNYKDVGAQIEVAQIILKIRSKHLNDLKEFNTNLIGNEGLVSQREKIFMQSNLTQSNREMNNLDTILTTNRSCILIPVIKPPSAKSVKYWLNSRTFNKNNQNCENDNIQEKIQVFIPNSPGQDYDNSQMEVMSLSSCSQISSGVLETTLEHNKLTPHKNLDSVKRNDYLGKTINSPEQCNVVSNKMSQKSDDSDDIMCGQKHSDDISFTVECVAKNNENEDILCKIENDNKTFDAYHSIADNTSEGLMSTSNAFKFSGDNYQNAEVYHENDFLTLLSLEVLTSTRGDYNPDPQLDPVCAVFYSILNDCPENHRLPQTETGFIIIEDDLIKTCRYLNGFSTKYNMVVVKNEIELFDSVLNIISKWDPEILCGYEVEMLSWGYLFQRAFVLNINLPNKISRVSLEDKFNFKKDSQEPNKEIRLTGRITIDIWRLLRHEIALTNYTFENIAYHVLHERLPLFSFKTLTFWWNHPSKLLKSLCVDYYLTRVTGAIRILQQLDLIGRTSELARLFGIQWYEVLSRGSQFRVESMMIRLTRTFNYILVSPTVQQRAAMKAPESLPLILEPESRFYSDPVIVLDFQSLYPSMIIAYNYCYSTCIGKVENIGKNGPFQFGASCLRISHKMLQKLSERDLINWSPSGVGFVKASVRKGVLPNMLQNILNTRFMVKKAMKKYKKNKTLQKILHNRQLGLKLIANVTYGYTAAHFSGRMPCVEVGDSVVAKGRETLERAIKVVENTPRWNAKVVYGDTDSIFVVVPGRNRSDAFDIGAEIAQMVTDDNPSPVKLKLEKVYQPCILQTKKRYVGYKYESKDQKHPDYDAKGIETVRRDGCPAASKILEKTLKILFETYDVSQVKSYIFRKFQNIIEGKCNVQDFIFAREFRGMNAYKPGASVPALEISKRYKSTDHRKEPREGERVPYIIVSGAPGEALLYCARCPRDLLIDQSLKINHTYYITRVIIPPLNRCLTLIGADVNLWFAEMPRKQLQPYPTLNVSGKLTENKKNTISQYFAKINCAGCDEETTEGLCIKCIIKPQETMVVLQNKINKWERNYTLTKRICQSCCGRAVQVDCVSINCPILFRCNSSKQDLQQIPFMQQMKKFYKLNPIHMKTGLKLPI